MPRTSQSTIVHAIFTQSLDTGELPRDWSLANVAPIFKKGNRALAENYRPVSLTCITCKLFEHIVCSHILDHVEDHKVLPKHTITLTTTQVQEAIQHSKNNNSVGPDNLSIRHLKHISPLGLTFLTSMYTAALNKNIIPHLWNLANIIPIPKPNKDPNMDTSYRPISLLSVVAKTLEKCLLPYITANITQTPTQHGYKAQHSTVTALHTFNNTVAKGFNQMAPLRELSL